MAADRTPVAEDAPSPPPLTLQDLNRDELLQLVSRSTFYRPRDLWGVRWRVLAERATVEGEALRAACDAYDQAASAVTALRGKPGKGAALNAAVQRADTAWKAYRVASAKSDRAEHAADRAWKALCACDGAVTP